VDLANKALHLRFSAETPLALEALAALVRTHAGASVSPQGVLSVAVPGDASPVVALHSLLAALAAGLPAVAVADL
jgi:hypothetical protein